MKIDPRIPLLTVALVFCAYMAGCSDPVRGGTSILTGTHCIEGVYYYKDGYGMAPALNTDGSPKLCGGTTTESVYGRPDADVYVEAVEATIKAVRKCNGTNLAVNFPSADAFTDTSKIELLCK